MTAKITKKQALDLLQELKDRLGNHPYNPAPTAPIEKLIERVKTTPDGRTMLVSGLMMNIYRAGMRT